MANFLLKIAHFTIVAYITSCFDKMFNSQCSIFYNFKCFLILICLLLAILFGNTFHLIQLNFLFFNDLILFRHVQNQIFIGGYWYVIYTRSWFRSCMGLRLRSRLGNFGKISRDFGKYSSRPGFSVYNLGKITEIWSRLIFFVYCSLNLNTVIVLLPRKQREKRTRSRISRSRRDLQWTEMDMSGTVLPRTLTSVEKVRFRRNLGFWCLLNFSMQI